MYEPVKQPFCAVVCLSFLEVYGLYLKCFLFYQVAFGMEIIAHCNTQQLGRHGLNSVGVCMSPSLFLCVLATRPVGRPY